MDGLNISVCLSVIEFAFLNMGLKRTYNFLVCLLRIIFCSMFLHSGAKSLVCDGTLYVP